MEELLPKASFSSNILVSHSAIDNGVSYEVTTTWLFLHPSSFSITFKERLFKRIIYIEKYVQILSVKRCTFMKQIYSSKQQKIFKKKENYQQLSVCLVPYFSHYNHIVATILTYNPKF